MKLYNTLTRTVDEINPLRPPEVTIYTCGPTVYDYPHVGNWFTYVREDLLLRTLKAAGYKPKWVMNITDVGHLVSDADEGEDKLEKGAKREGKSAWDIAKFYSDYFVEGMQRLNMLKPDFLPKATEHIPEQIGLIQQLEDKGFTYTIADGIYYDTSKFPRYADFAQLDIDEQQAGARIEINPDKRQSTDFALWKFSPSGQQRDMEWDSPWGKGFPGWHIECSAMSMKYLGETLDIHAGGIDHVPVHHTNEIAQSEAITGKPFASVWMHSNHITIEGEKVSKSLGNGITLEDIEAKGISLEAFRLHVLESHYRSQSKFSWESLQAAQNRLRDLRAMAALQWQAKDSVNDAPAFGFIDVRSELLEVLANDLDTPSVLARLSEISAETQTVLIHPRLASYFKQMLEDIDDLLGLQLASEPDITDAQKQILIERAEARQHGDWEKSDKLRDTLVEQGISIRDTSYGPVWSRL